MKNIIDFAKKKQAQNKITMITCYDAAAAKIAAQTEIDCVLVGDSVSMVVHGFDNTTSATMDMMEMHTAAVARGKPGKFIVGDMPFCSYRVSLADTMDNVQRLVQAGAQAVKLEGAEGNLATIKHIVHSGVPVIGHLGLTPQHLHTLGGFRVQGRSEQAREQLITQARAVQTAGCFALVLECVPADLATAITKELDIPTIGIGAGAGTDGQVLVWHDVLGLQSGLVPKFLKQFAQSEQVFIDSINQYVTEVNTSQYPSAEYEY